MSMRLLALGAAVLLAATLVSPGAGAQSAASIFRFETDEFWLNLHHFLYVLGRAEAKFPDAARDAVRSAPADAEAGLESLTADERKTWAEAVTAYAKDLSGKSPIFDEPLRSIAYALVAADDAATLKNTRIDGDVRAVLERAAPIYRKAWWPAHVAANRTYQAATQALVDRHGQTILGFITRAYGMRWSSDGYPVHFVAYAVFQGNYSLASDRGSLLVMSTNPNRANAGLFPLEIAFHEGMHQWDTQVFDLLGSQARALKTTVPRDLPHALIFYTSGDAVRRIDPSHAMYLDSFGIWNGRLSGATVPAIWLKQPIEEIWKPYLDGKGTRDEAFRALLTRTAAAAKP